MSPLQGTNPRRQPLFNCKDNPITLSPLELWDSPTEVAKFLKLPSTPLRSRGLQTKKEQIIFFLRESET